MNHTLPKSANRDQQAFTLLELLVVISIIAVLAGLLLPVGQKVLENSRKVVTKNTESQIIAAVNSYQTEYGQYPVDTSVSGDYTAGADYTFGATNQNNHQLFDVLRGNIGTSIPNNSPLNTRRVVYFEGKNVKNASNPRDGFVTVASGAKSNPQGGNPIALQIGDLVDPWGNLYAVRVDTGYDNQVLNPYTSQTSNPTDDDSGQTDLTKVLRTGVISWTYGADGIQASKNVTLTAPYSPTPGDDVDSWQ